ncbi:alpha/beta fold hydrolase [Altererythrobacter aurantiacus]|uniref:Alpha/beta fold hydrolase n=1 Tax=Parapontixanthobacter aurantiacus TaxID=1463599 RepID=A0A844ZE62_9SPHN|nr:alpha/beta fold hydrolase [Parapontixanthobacter aurantiacus]
MAETHFEGFGGVRLSADEWGTRHSPTVLFLPDIGQVRGIWHDAAAALAGAGRHVIAVDLRGSGASEEPGDRRYDADAFIGDLYAVLGQLSSRPVVVGAGRSARLAAIALGEAGPDLASGLVLVERYGAYSSSVPDDAPASGALDERTRQALERITTPILQVSANDSEARFDRFASARTDIEAEAMLAPSHPDHEEHFHAMLVEFLERRVPRTADEYVTGVDPRTLRDALGTFATGVTIVTATAPDGSHVGLTANSFTSVSLDPPLLLVCPARNAGSMAALEQAEHFAVNVLHIGQQSVSNLFAMKGEDRFAETEFELWDRGVPILDNALANFECRKYAEYDGGDHVILVGEVERVRYAPQRDPLLYFRGKYRRLHFG